jgi:hypothetical protein
MAAGRGFPEIVQLLLDSPKFVDINATCNNGNTALHFAISCYLESQSATIAKMVIARPDFHINTRNKVCSSYWPCRLTKALLTNLLH